VEAECQALRAVLRALRGALARVLRAALARVLRAALVRVLRAALVRVLRAALVRVLRAALIRVLRAALIRALRAALIKAHKVRIPEARETKECLVLQVIPVRKEAPATQEIRAVEQATKWAQTLLIVNSKYQPNSNRVRSEFNFLLC